MEAKAVPLPNTGQPVQACKFCKASIPTDAFYCPNCGKKLRERPPATDILHQIGLYLFSLLLPPLGLIPALKYIRQDNLNSKIIGIVAIAITVIVSVITIYYTIDLINGLNTQLNSELNVNGY